MNGRPRAEGASAGTAPSRSSTPTRARARSPACSPPTSRSSSRTRNTASGSSPCTASSHYGAAGYYAIRAARAGMVGISTTNSEPFVIPYGGIGHALGTNPIALAAPTPDDPHTRHRHGHQPGRGQQDLQRPRRRAHDPRGLGRRRAGVGTTTDPGAVFAAGPARRLQGLRARPARRDPLRRAVGLGRRGTAWAASTRRPSRRTSGTSTSRSTPGRLARPRAGCAALLGRLLGDLKQVPAAPRCRRGARARRARGARARQSASATASRSRRRCGRRCRSSARTWE